MVPENERRTPYPGPSAELRDKVRSGVFVYVHSDARLKCRTFLNGFGASVPGGYSWGTYATVSVNTNPIVRQSRLRFQNGTYPIKRAHLPSSAVVRHVKPALQRPASRLRRHLGLSEESIGVSFGHARTWWFVVAVLLRRGSEGRHPDGEVQGQGWEME